MTAHSLWQQILDRRRNPRDPSPIYRRVPAGTPLDLLDALEALDAALPGYEEARLYYEGDIGEFFEDPRLEEELRGTAVAYRFRLARTPVTALASRIRIASISVPGNTQATEAIARIRKANDMDNLESDLIRDMLADGDAYVLVWPYEHDDDPDDAGDDELVEAGIEISYNSPTCGRMLYDEQHPTRKRLYLRRWAETTRGTGTEKDTTVWRADLYYPDGVKCYVSADHKPGEALGTWSEHTPDTDDDHGDAGREGEGEGEGYSLPTPEAGGNELPVFHLRNEAPYGRPEHKDAYGPQDAINKALITQLTVMDSHGAPHRYRVLAEDAELNSDNDDPQWDDAPTTGDREPGVGRYRMRSGQGVEDVYTGTKEVGQFAAADLDTFNAPVELHIRMMAFATGTPLHYFPITGQQPSGLSRILDDAPLDDRADDRRRRLTGTLTEMWRYILRLAGHTVDEVVIEWAPPRLVLDKEWWETAQIKREMGVPLEQILREAGYTPTEINDFTNAASGTPDGVPAPRNEETGHDD
ncbi:hypothetical protein [Streptomyces sp. ST2-7A]|uniref:hypothetical protein n=1 Tax=Streptomyces sp. ST2-7A TaxID=2907214 RepID=UPI001F2F4ED7|nr:hypothetical protein [Streptomyces sp. ST2-7A]MCE7081154.1 hypothetical protein [Streptomyces sp. ST2-7A]